MNNPTPNIGSILYVAIVNGLIADSTWNELVNPANFNRYDNLQGIQTPDPQATSDSDYPQATLMGPVSGKINLTGNDQTFATHSLQPEGDWIEPGQWVFRLRVVSALLGMQEYTAQTMESINALRRLGPRLGLNIDGDAFITGVAVQWKEREGQSDTDNLRRIITDIEITITTEIHGQTLTGV
jgi:hypothetical protein